MKKCYSHWTAAARNGALAIALTGAISTAAAAEEFSFTPIDEIPEGQGLITDESGEFTIFKWDRNKRNRSGSNDPAPQAAPAPAQTITSTSGITEAATPE